MTFRIRLSRSAGAAEFALVDPEDLLLGAQAPKQMERVALKQPVVQQAPHRLTDRGAVGLEHDGRYAAGVNERRRAVVEGARRPRSSGRLRRPKAVCSTDMWDVKVYIIFDGSGVTHGCADTS